MKPTSPEYRNSMASPMRNRSFVRVTFGNIDTTAALDGSWASSGAMGWSSFNELDLAYEYGHTYATLELNRWSLDGNFDILPNNVLSARDDGFISSAISNSSGSLLPNGTVTKTFTAAHPLPGVTLSFDTRTGEYPTSITVLFYLNGTVVSTNNYSPDSAGSYEIENTVNADSMRIVFSGMLPYRRPRLESIVWGIGREYGNDDIVSCRQSHDVDPLSRWLPNETLSFTIFDLNHIYDPDNPSGIFSFIDKFSPVEIQYGYMLPSNTVEWLKADKYSLTSRPEFKNERVTFSAVGMVQSLNDTYYKGVQAQTDFYSLAEAVLLDAGLPLTPQGNNPWEIDDSLKQMFTVAPLPIAPHMNCLQLIAHACRCTLYTDDDNIIHIKPFGLTTRGIFDGTWSAVGATEWYSEYSMIDDGGSGETHFDATLELNRWTLEYNPQQTFSIMQPGSPPKLGYVADALSGSTGANYPERAAAKDFDVKVDLRVLRLVFSALESEWPSSVEVRYYDTTTSPSTLLDTQTASPTSNEAVLYSDLAVGCNRIEVRALAGLPYRRHRLYGAYFRESDFVLDFASIIEDSQSISQIDKLKGVSVSQYSFAPSSSGATTLYEGALSDTSLHVEFSQIVQGVSINVTGATLASSSIYARASDMTFTNVTDSASITITGNAVEESSIVVIKPVNNVGEMDITENAMITNSTMRSALADHIAQYLTMRNTYDVAYRGNPEVETRDLIGLQTPYTEQMDAIVLTDTIDFNGSLKGTIKAKGIL